MRSVGAGRGDIRVRGADLCAHHAQLQHGERQQTGGEPAQRHGAQSTQPGTEYKHASFESAWNAPATDICIDALYAACATAATG